MKQHKMVRFTYSAALVLLGGVLGGGLAWSPGTLYPWSAADSPPQTPQGKHGDANGKGLIDPQIFLGNQTPQGKHGDASAEQQLAELQKLKLPPDVTKAPAGLDPVVWAAYVPADNQMTPERVELGRKLYFDTRLSVDNSVSCATCHDVTRGFTDQRAVSEGIKGQLGKRNAPTTLNAVLLQTFFWDGRSPSLGPPGQDADPQSGRDGHARRGDRLEGHPRRSRVSGGLQEGLRPGNELRGRGPGDRGLRADAGLRRLALPPLPQRRCGGHLGPGPCRLGSVQRQGPLRGLPPDEPLQPAGHRQSLPQRGRVGPPPELRGLGARRPSRPWPKAPRNRSWTNWPWAPT